LAAQCEFHNVNNEVKSAIIQNCRSELLRRFALREEHLTLEALLSKARALENREKQAQGIEKQLASTNIYEEANRIGPRLVLLAENISNVEIVDFRGPMLNHPVLRKVTNLS
jgi:hypothetical protein